MGLLDERHRRILTTHVGSLPRRQSLSEMLLARLNKQPFDAKALARETTAAVVEIVDKQKSLGIDIVSDGEQSKTSFQNYIADRLTGLQPITPQPGERRTRENMAFPTHYKNDAHSGSQFPRLACTGPIRYAGQRQLAEVIPLQGGVPIKVGETTIGGVGLSGAPNGGPQEEACGKAGVAKVADQLK